MAAVEDDEQTLDGQPFANHPAFSGSHAHPHPGYGSQGGDNTHAGHRHVHDGDSSHDHHKAPVAASGEAPEWAWPHGMRAFIRAGGDGTNAWQVVTAAGEPIVRVAEQIVALGAPGGVEQRQDGRFTVLTAAGGDLSDWPSYAEAVGVLAEQLAVDGPRPVLAQTWRSDMSFEGVSTGDGRYIMPGATTFRDCPLPLMLQTVTEGGHMGAVLAGSIGQTGMVGSTAQGVGPFDDSDAARQFVDIIHARGRYGVSIDVAEAEIDDDASEAAQEARFSLIKIMGLTGTPFPAFENAYIELAAVPAQPVAAAGNATASFAGGDVVGNYVTGQSNGVQYTLTPALGGNDTSGHVSPASSDPPCVECDEQTARAAAEAQQAGPGGLTAAAGPAVPPAAWFENPGFVVGDDRLVMQPNGAYACPLTVTKDGKVFGHMASWNGCHTGYANECKTPPRSQTNYAAFLTGMLETVEGELVRVGQITMGCGHASTSPTLKPHQVTAHYDGGPGAVAMCDVACGEDQFGIWFSGALRPTVTENDIRRFQSMAVSGDWRQVWDGKGLDLLACLAGVPAPGFPIAALAAAGFAPLDASDLPAEPVYTFNEVGKPAALVAAGVIRQPAPWETVQGNQQRQIDDLRAELARVARIANPLRHQAAAELVASLNGNK